MGLPEGVPVFNGAHDQYCASLGAGAIHGGDMLLSAGTTWVLMGITEKPLFTDSFIAPGKHPVEGLYGAITSLTASGAAMQWFKEQFMQDSFEEINRAVAGRRDRVKELFFYPYQAGANYPLWNPAARGVFAGVTLEHDRFDFARAIMEGAAFGVRRAVEDFRRNGAEIRSILMMGGAAKSEPWTRIIAAAANVPLVLLDQADVCAVGAAVIAARGAGLFGDYAGAARAMSHVRCEIVPEAEDAAWYADKFDRFDRLWRQLAGYYK
jgi:sugar (pentulose or hexulose) kinase